ncbi:NAD-dependent epimerase/dehydratase family protein [uncultured Draconibacterium sp.]|uniref:NAD-dependent epimerase/dehydratase family protein n=1 Tax=uncultured Draconibacterium sp. TaxID=1573823 RepID=UPI002AA8FF78|nr:NAD-dependent epimerase/dehydratase family protein [uncultured Draconibacterium sp.]
MKKYKIGISCIGSGVGQSVINSLRLSRLPVETIGFGSNPFAFGEYDCDAYDYTKTIYEEGYIDNIILKCKQHKIDLLIPGLDDEVLIFAQNEERLKDAGINAIYPDEELIAICRDKERMSNELNKIADVFVKSYNRQTLVQDIELGKSKYPFIAKPRGGFASRGIQIINNKEDLAKITDKHILQELAIPVKTDPNYDFYTKQIKNNINPQVSEVSIQIVYSQDGKLMGRMFSYNKLNNGVPIEIVPYDNEYVWNIIDKLTPTFLKMGLRGPLNIQGRITENGLKLFEMNPRFTGITGLRALMGFNEVEACVKEWLDIDKGKNQLRFNYNRFGVRQTADKSIPLERDQKVLNLFQTINQGEIKKRKTLLITGAGGYLGRNLIRKLSGNDKFEIWAFDLDKTKLKEHLGNKADVFLDSYDLDQGRVGLGNVDILIHMGFTRPHGSNQKIANSLEFTGDLFTRSVLNHIPAIINISSQSVYGLQSIPPWNEDTPVAPESTYAQAKYASELMLSNAKRHLNTLCFSSIRLASLSGGADGLVEVDFLSKFVKLALAGEPIKLLGGMQLMERLDVRDAVDAIIKMLNTEPVNWKPVYNLGTNRTYTLKKFAEKSIEISSSKNGGIRSELLIEDKDIQMKFGMDSSSFYEDMNWNPTYSMNDTICSLVSYFQREENMQSTLI